MIRFAGIAAVAIVLLAPQASQPQEAEHSERDACILRCIRNPRDPDLARQEIVSLEREAGHAIGLKNGSFFRRVYSEDFVGTLSHGQQVNKAQWIGVIETNAVKYDSFTASDIKVQIYQDMAIATCLWSSRGIIKGQPVSHQMRAIHVYLNGASGWHVVSGQNTNLPPDVQQAL
jgi:ketosteroid isomerase-like protein